MNDQLMYTDAQAKLHARHQQADHARLVRLTKLRRVTAAAIPLLIRRYARSTCQADRVT